MESAEERVCESESEREAREMSVREDRVVSGDRQGSRRGERMRWAIYVT